MAEQSGRGAAATAAIRRAISVGCGLAVPSLDQRWDALRLGDDPTYSTHLTHTLNYRWLPANYIIDRVFLVHSVLVLSIGLASVLCVLTFAFVFLLFLFVCRCSFFPALL